MRTQSTLLISLLLLFSISCSAQKTSAENINKIAKLEKPRAAHTATLLKDGNVLIVGGMHKNGLFYDEVEVFDPKQNSFTILKNRMTKKRVSHTATLLKDGRVLIVGGWSDRHTPEKTAELFEPKSHKFIAIGNTRFARSGHSSTLLQNGKVLIAGGYDGTRNLSEAELFDPATNRFEVIGKMKSGHNIHSATRLKNGEVLITGGENSEGLTTNEVEIFDPATNKFRKISAQMMATRYKHDSVLLADGSVLIFGGSDSRDRAGKLKSAEIFDPLKETFKPTGDMNFARFKIRETGVLLADGNVLIAGGGIEAEIFRPDTNSFESVTGSFGISLHYSSVTLLEDGRALILGGYEFIRGGEPTSTNQAWIFSGTGSNQKAK